MTRTPETREQGVALVFTLFLMAALSAMAVSMMFLAQTETAASRNYKTMSQARYAGEAGVHRALHYLSSTAYTDSVTATTGFDTSVSPVRYNGQPVVLAPVSTNSNHPDATIKAAFAALFTTSAATMAAGSGTVSYTASATLVSMRLVNVYGGTPKIIQTWRINGTGMVPVAGAGSAYATVEVAGILERNSVPAETYAIFATGTGCGAITMSGNVTTDSFDYGQYQAWLALGNSGPPPTQNSGGSVGSNGNLTIGGNVIVNGNLDTPRAGVGSCNNGNITALTQTGGATVSGDTVQLPQAKNYPTPSAPSPVGTSTLNISTSSSCLHLGLPVGVMCTGGSGVFSITTFGITIPWGDVTMEAGTSITFLSGVPGDVTTKLNVNTFAMEGSSSINLGAGMSVVLNAKGDSVPSNQAVIDLTGGSLVNGTGSAAFDASRFQILYAGTGTIMVGGSTDTAATIYAPNALVDMNGNADFYGSILSNRFRDNGGASVHYDRSLGQKFFTVGQHVLSSFSWQKY